MLDSEIRGLRETQAKMQQREAAIKRTIPDLMKTAVLFVLSRIPPYPAAPVDSSYQRTGTLGRVITTFSNSAGGGDVAPLSRVETINSGAVGFVGGRLRYINEVIGEGEQAAVHRGRWWVLQAVVRSAKSGIIDIFRYGIRAIMR